MKKNLFMNTRYLRLRLSARLPKPRRKRVFNFQAGSMVMLFMLACAMHIYAAPYEMKLPVKRAIRQLTVHGKVTDSSGNPLIGVSVSVRGTSAGTTTDANGDYSLTVKNDNAVLIFSYVGFNAKEVSLNGRSVVNVTLSSGVSVLNQVVVTALGLERKVRSLTSSSQNVDAKQLKKIEEPDVMTALQGKVAGASITLGGMEMGSPARVVIRGNRSINGDSQPLYVIDGVPISGAPSSLNTNNISSINILKGPSAAALYGSEAQNGVVVITTRHGVAGVNSMSFNSNFSVRSPLLSYPFQNQYGQGVNGKFDPHSDLSWGPEMEGQMVDTWSQDPADKGNQYPLTPQPDNVKDFFRTGKIWTNNLSISRGGQNVQTIFSFTNVYGEGILPNNSLKRNNLYLRISSDLLGENGNGPLKLDGKLSYTHEQRKGNVQYGGFQGSVNNIYTIPRNIRESRMRNFEYTDSAGADRQNYWVPGSIWAQNPYWRAYRNVESNTLKQVIGFLSLKYDFSDYLSLQVRGSYEGKSNNDDLKLYNDTYNTAEFGRYRTGQSNSYLLHNDFLLSFKKTYHNWKTDINLGGSLQKQKSDFVKINTGKAMVIPNFFSLANSTLLTLGDPNGNGGLGASNQVIQSLYAFGHFSYKNNIFLDISGRNDWSSTLPKESLSYFYPSVGLGAVISDLIPGFPRWISFAKIEASASQVGSGAPPYMLDRTATFSPGGNNGFITLDPILPNEHLKPEITRSYEGGIKLRFFKDRFGLDLTAYKTNTFNQLFKVNLPVGSGASSYFTNGGNIQNKGIEAVLNATVLKTKDVTWAFDVNFSANRSKVLKINDERPKVEVGQITIEEGQPFGNIYGRGFVRDSVGRVIVGSNGLPEVTTGSTVLIANFNPDWLGSISSTFFYKNFSVSFQIDHRQGGSMLSLKNASMYGIGLTKATLKGREGGLVFGDNFFSHENAVLENGHVNDIPVTAQQFWLSYGGRNQDIVEELYKVSATNTRLRSLSLTYALPLSKPRAAISGLEFSLFGRNLFFIQRASKTVDPDLKVGTGPDNIGISNFTLPTIRSFGIDVKVNFR